MRRAGDPQPWTARNPVCVRCPRLLPQRKGQRGMRTVTCELRVVSPSHRRRTRQPGAYSARRGFESVLNIHLSAVSCLGKELLECGQSETRPAGSDVSVLLCRCWCPVSVSWALDTVAASPSKACGTVRFWLAAHTALRRVVARCSVTPTCCIQPPTPSSHRTRSHWVRRQISISRAISTTPCVLSGRAPVGCARKGEPPQPHCRARGSMSEAARRIQGGMMWMHREPALANRGTTSPPQRHRCPVRQRVDLRVDLRRTCCTFGPLHQSSAHWTPAPGGEQTPGSSWWELAGGAKYISGVAQLTGRCALGAVLSRDTRSMSRERLFYTRSMCILIVGPHPQQNNEFVISSPASRWSPRSSVTCSRGASGLPAA